MFMAYDSSCVMTLTRKDDHLFNFRMYDLNDNYNCCRLEKFGGRSDSFIKVNEIEQYKDSSVIAIPYIDNGIF